MPEIQENQKETFGEKVQKIAVIGGIAITLASTLQVGDYFISKDVDLKVEKVSKYEYSQIKPEIVNIAREHGKNEKDPMTWDQYRIWVATADIEYKKCSEADLISLLSDIDETNAVEKINIIISNNCKQ